MFVKACANAPDDLCPFSHSLSVATETSVRANAGVRSDRGNFNSLPNERTWFIGERVFPRASTSLSGDQKATWHEEHASCPSGVSENLFLGQWIFP